MPTVIVKVISVLLSIISSISLAFSGVTEKIISENYDYAKSFDQVQYENQLVPTLDEDGYWTFNTDRDLKVVQLTDVHIGGGSMSKDNDKRAMNAVAALLTYEKPDLVVFTGDMVYPVPFQAGTFNNSLSTRMLIDLLETLGVYYTVCFGNHDSEAYGTHTREQISNMWADPDLKYSLYQAGPEDIYGYGNHVIKVKNSRGIVTNAFFMLDSNEYVDGDILGIQWKYDSIHQDQIDWYKENVLAIDAANKAIDSSYPMFKSLAFFHIPLEEFGIAWNEYRDNGYQDTEDVKVIDGYFHEKGEKSYPGIYGCNMFETMQELGSTQGVFCGHDHVNNAIINYKGINLVYGMSIDYLAYSELFEEGAQRGCTVITVPQDGDISISLENYYQDKYVSKYEKEPFVDQWA